ncbi:hypothetical protein SHAM105786_15185 [Shewanella amazonensis]
MDTRFQGELHRVTDPQQDEKHPVVIVLFYGCYDCPSLSRIVANRIRPLSGGVASSRVEQEKTMAKECLLLGKDGLNQTKPGAVLKYNLGQWAVTSPERLRAYGP